MTQTDEKELVLGNKQLLSLFFVVVALCGVFFAVGYRIGQNSTKITPVTSAESTAMASPVARQQPEPPRETVQTQPDTTPEQQPAPVETRPAQDTAVKEAPGSVPVSTPEIGASYVQVAAVPRPDAENMVRTLREQSFHAILAESSKDGFFRVLAGPYRETVQTADAKNRLKTLGFGQAFVFVPK